MNNLLETLKQAILGNLGPLKSAPKNWHKRNCPMCVSRGFGQDTRSRFGIQLNPQSIALHCFNCGFSSAYTDGEPLSNSFKTFLNVIGVDRQFVKTIEFEQFKLKHSIVEVREGDATRTRITPFASVTDKWLPISLPENSLSLMEWANYGLTDPNFLKVLEYAVSRRIYDLDKFYWSPSEKFCINQRLIIPYWYKGNTTGFTARLCYNADKRIPKYYQQCPTDFVYNLDNQRNVDRKYVIVTEGVLDAWAVDGVGILGEMNQVKADLINRLHKVVVVSPDRDQKGRDLVDFAIANDWGVSFPKWSPDIKDAAAAAAKYGGLLTTSSILAAITEGTEKIKLKWDISFNELTRRNR